MPLLLHQMPLNIESDISDQDPLILFLEDEIAANSRPYPRNELSELKRLGNYYDYQSLVFKQKAEEQVNELERLLALRYHAKSYPIQVDYTRELIKEYRIKADECSDRANTYRANIQP